MSVTWFMIKCLIVTFVIISFMQLRVGERNDSLEIHFKNWMTNLSASKRIQNVAEGGQQISSQVIKEFITEDGTRVTVTSPREPANQKKSSVIEMGFDQEKKSGVLETVLLKDNAVLSRFLKGFKLETSDLSKNAHDTLKAEVQKEMSDELNQRIKKSGLNPQTFEMENNQKEN